MRSRSRDSGGKLDGRRGEIAILAEILRLAENGAGQTKIMYGCNLSYQGMRTYLQSLQKTGLVRVTRTSSGAQFTTTAKGKSLLSCLETALDLLQQ